MHTLPSLQFSPPVPAQTPFEHESPVVQSLPSSQEPLAIVCVQPLNGAHVSVVQGLPSEQSAGVPLEHAPSRQASPMVHGSPSLQTAPLAGLPVQPEVASQPSVVHGLLSSQLRGAPP